MSARRLHLDPRALRSRVARRIFVVFAVCSMLPVGAFALFSFWQVRSQLEADARSALRHASKAAGMSILERLMIAEQELMVVGGHFDDADHAKGGHPLPSGARLRRVETWPEAWLEDRLTPRQREHLRSGGSVLQVEAADAPPARIWLVRASGEGGRGAIWAAELEPEFLFVPRRRIIGDQYWVADDQGALLFESPPGAAGPGARVRGEGTAGEERAFTRTGADGEEIGARWPLFLRTRYRSPSWTIAFSRPRSEVERPLREFEATFPLVALAAFGVALTLSLAEIRRSFGPIDRLTEASRRLSKGDLDARVDIRSDDEFGRLGGAFNAMAGEIARQIRVLSAVNSVGRALSAELDTQALLDLILRESMRVTESMGAALFLSLDGDPLALARLHLAGRDGRLATEGDALLAPVVARRCLSRGVTLSAAGLSDLPGFERDAWREAEARLGASVGPQVAVPMRDGRGDAMGVLILFREAGADGYSSASCELVESLASQAATAIAKNHMVDSFRSLFEGVIQLTVRAIDEKSSYTAAHCRNVPILTELIADAACATQRGPLKDFDLSPDERYELRIAALLHDCGKVATPVHVMDKATKLETICDRIELIDTRCEIVRRDIAANADDAPAQEVERRLAELESDRRFLRRCNRGVEWMPDADVQRVRSIAARYTYTGADGEHRPLLEPEDVRNLTIRRGTLNPDERQVIEQHVVTTIDLLSELPFPRTLQAVPAIAGSHHERVDGGGYPNQLTRDQISLQGRILGLADVFEALTARDRPYKVGRTLTETFRILDQMRDEGAIDPDVYDLFKAEKVYLPYIAENVRPEQIDGDYWEELERFTSGA